MKALRSADLNAKKHLKTNDNTLSSRYTIYAVPGQTLGEYTNQPRGTAVDLGLCLDAMVQELPIEKPTSTVAPVSSSAASSMPAVSSASAPAPTMTPKKRRPLVNKLTTSYDQNSKTRNYIRQEYQAKPLPTCGKK